MTPLRATDLTVVEGGALVSDATVMKVLGIEHPHVLRELVARHRVELEGYGLILTQTEVKSGGSRGRPRKFMLFNEQQALLVTMFSRTERAAEARRVIIEVFQAWRHGQIRLERARRTPPHDAALIDELAGRRQAILRLVGTIGAADCDRKTLEALPLFKRGTRPKFWYDLPVREFVTRKHRRAIMRDVLRECAERFGADRTPSLSGLNRYWVNLDRVFGNNETSAARRLSQRMGDQ